jgi:2,4-dienoyl-CoA reductase-like NADH-dependent reductase (Old Yellow Enzyme family)/thioredoxin reductase
VQKLKYLFRPIKIGTMEVQNRIVMSGMDPGFGIDDDGCVTDQLIEYLVERARSRPGMIVTGAKPVHPLGSADPNTIKMVPLWEERVLPSLERMVRAVHQYDVRFGAQLNHAGLAHLPQESVCPSTIPELASMGLPLREATRDDLKEYIQAFAVAAERCVKVGFDFVEIHAGHGYLINTFLTPFYNRRTDEYGGSFENRIRFLLEIIAAVRRSIGPTVPIGVRVNGDDFIGQGGWNLSDLCRLAPILEKETVDYVSISAGASTMGTLHYTVMPIYQDQGVFSHFSEEIKKHISIPVSIVGRVKDPVMADRLVAEKKADLVVMARAQLADPDMVEKARSGDLADIRLCIADCLGCIEGVLRHGEASCTVNPRLGREYQVREVEGEKRATARRVLVAGAGPAGLEAARRAAFAGHKVTLCESRGWIGGQMRLASLMPKRSEIGDIIPWYERQLNKLGVEVRLNVNVEAALLDEIKPDVLVIATGSLPEVPLGFVDGLSHIKEIDVLMIDELVEDGRLTGDNVLVVGGDQIGLQVADYLAERGKVVTVVEKAAHFGEKLANADRRFLTGRLIDRGVKRYKNVEKVDIQATDDVWMICGGKREKLPGIDTIVLANERRPNIFLAEIADRKGIEKHIIGDAGGVAGEGQGTIMAAFATGYDVGRRI